MLIIRRILKLITCVFIGLVLTANTYAATTNSTNTLLQFNVDMTQLHDGIPVGVPTGYDWAKHPRMGKGNIVPTGYTAMTGWGQVFWNANTPVTAPKFQIRNFQTLMCNGTNHTWSLIQSGDITGAQFNANFINNTSVPASTFTKSGNVFTIGFQNGPYTFHFWPKQGRVAISPEPSCGYVVMLDARAIPSTNKATSSSVTGNFLIGLGADYWATTTSAWSYYQTNKDIAIGKLKTISQNWATYGVSTASDADLNNLYVNGYSQ